jgi:acetyltransferase-like isoleucine patch superfamily enzyme
MEMTHMDRKGMEALRRKLSKEVRSRWDRVLPWDEMLLDRWKKASESGFGEGTNCYEHVFIYGKPRIGKGVWIGFFTLLDGTGGLDIGDGCDISVGAQLYSHSTHARCVSGRKLDIVRRPTRIGKCVFIGPNAIVMAGVNIGDHCVIGAGSVVNRDIPAYSVAAGVPARILKRVRRDFSNIEPGRPGGKNKTEK